jgi:hypothetical protein
MSKRRAVLIVVSLVVTFAVLRAYLSFSPNTDLNIGRYNIHHLFSGLLLMTFCGIPLVLWNSRSRLMDALTIGFGIGLGMALDEWVYLIATDGTNASYLLPISFWGGAIMISIGVVYTLVLMFFNRKK